MNSEPPKPIRLIENNTAIEIISRDQQKLGVPLYGIALGLTAIIIGLTVGGGAFAPIAIGIFFILCCGLLLYTADERRIILRPVGQSEVITRRRLSNHIFRQTFKPEDIQKIEFYYMLGEKAPGRAYRMDAIYIALQSGEKIEILSRMGRTFLLKKNQSLAAEADYIANFLRIDLDTKDATTIMKSTQQFRSFVEAPLHDRARIGIPPPTNTKETDKT